MTLTASHPGSALVAASTPDTRYAAALRHSRRVRLLRKAIPIGSLLTVIALFTIVYIGPFRALPDGVSIGAVSLNGSRVTMELPRLTGFKKDNRPYEVTAQWASQDIKQPSIIELRDLKARIALQDRSTATVEAVDGIYDSTSEKLDLRTDVRVRTEQGYDVRMKSANVDFKAGNVTSADPVTVKFNGGTIDASRVDMYDSGAHIVFHGRVRSVMQPAAGAPTSKDKTP
ncbi:LPS export ABC transporter periplasmic protein LptC [Alsobacter sp. R-9]